MRLIQQLKTKAKELACNNYLSTKVTYDNNRIYLVLGDLVNQYELEMTAGEARKLAERLVRHANDLEGK